MKKMIFPALVAGLFAVSCSKKEAKTESTTVTADSVLTEKVDSTATKTDASVTTEKVSLSGTFEGTIPCADCPGIETKLTLNEQDKSYTIESNYLEKKDGKFSDKGTFEVSEDGTFITLKEEGNSTPQVYHITSDAAYLVTKVGDKELKQEYKLVRK